MVSKHPSYFFPELSEDRLTTIAELLLDVRFNTVNEMNSQYDDAYTRECAVFGRSKNALIELCISGEHDWLNLVNSRMDVTFSIGSIPCRFFRDDPESPKKRGFFIRNRFDDLFSENDSTPVMWRFVVERAMTTEDEDRAFFIGHNMYQEKVCQWSYSPGSTILHSVDRVAPPVADLPPAEVGIRDNEQQKENFENCDSEDYHNAQNE